VSLNPDEKKVVDAFQNDGEGIFDQGQIQQNFSPVVYGSVTVCL